MDKPNSLSPAALDLIRSFTNSHAFLEIKDHFISSTPEKGYDGREGDSDSKNLGKFLGTRFVFNRLQELARKAPVVEAEKTKTNNRGKSSGTDPDLES